MPFNKNILTASLLAGCLAGFYFVPPQTVSASDDPKATANPAPPQIEPWKPEDIIYMERANQFRIAPDAKWLVWVKSTGDKEKDCDRLEPGALQPDGK